MTRLGTLPSQWFLAPARLTRDSANSGCFVERGRCIEIQIIISIVRVTEYFSKMLVLSGVFNTRILDATNYANQDYMRVNYTLIVVALCS
jgi:hypothetical protein